MSSSTRMCLLIIQIAGLSVLSSPSHAIDLTGAWATDQTVCEKLFVKKGKSIAFRPDAVMRSSGFIIDGNSIRGKAIKCAIKTRREEGQVVHLGPDARPTFCSRTCSSALGSSTTTGSIGFSPAWRASSKRTSDAGCERLGSFFRLLPRQFSSSPHLRMGADRRGSSSSRAPRRSTAGVWKYRIIKHAFIHPAQWRAKQSGVR